MEPLPLPARSRPRLTASPTRPFDLAWLALGHRARRAILRDLVNCGMLTPCELAKHFPHASRSSLSEHLQALRDANLVTVERHALDRRKLCYRANTGALAVLAEWLLAAAPEAAREYFSSPQVERADAA